MRYEVRVYITLDANDQNEARRRASEIADAAADTEPALAAAANVACEDGEPELVDD